LIFGPYGQKTTPTDLFCLEDGAKSFHKRIVAAATNAAHADLNSMIPQESLNQELVQSLAIPPDDSPAPSEVIAPPVLEGLQGQCRRGLVRGNLAHERSSQHGVSSQHLLKLLYACAQV
jgi:hypothetical protein